MADQLETRDQRWADVDKVDYVAYVQSFSDNKINDLKNSTTYTTLSTELTQTQRDALKAYLISLKTQIREKLQNSLTEYVSNVFTTQMLGVKAIDPVSQLNIIDINKLLPLDTIKQDTQLTSVVQGLTAKQDELNNDNIEEKYRYAQSKNSQTILTSNMEADKALLENTDALIQIIELIP